MLIKKWSERRIMNKEELREELQNYSKPKLIEMCIKLLEEKEKSLSDNAATYDELLEMEWNDK
jgi:hypothetical protein